MTIDTVTTFEKPFIPAFYDALVRSIYAPVGGERALRAQAVRASGVVSGMRVLELGCGTGSFTRRLCAIGAEVTAIDGSARMIERARKKAPRATFDQQDLRTLALPAAPRYDAVWFGFVLHELSPDARERVLAGAARALRPGGAIVIVDHAVPTRGGLARVWRSFLLALEPETVRSVIERGYDAELSAAGLTVFERTALAHGTAMIVTARPAAT